MYCFRLLNEVELLQKGSNLAPVQTPALCFDGERKSEAAAEHHRIIFRNETNGSGAVRIFNQWVLNLLKRNKLPNSGASLGISQDGCQLFNDEVVGVKDELPWPQKNLFCNICPILLVFQ